MRPLLAVLCVAAAALVGCGRGGDGGSGQMREVRMAVRSAATDPRLANRWSAYQALIPRAYAWR